MKFFSSRNISEAESCPNWIIDLGFQNDFIKSHEIKVFC